MKKIVLIILIIIVVYTFRTDEYNISEDSIRFRVIANSNSIKDISMKEKVVEELSNILFIDSDDKEKIEKNIYNNINNIENKITELFKKNNYNNRFNILYGINKFPKKEYRGKTYKEGYYKSLVIEIGEAKGDNYFCFLYPSLCLIDLEDNKEKVSFKIIDLVDKYINTKNN